MDFLSFNVPLYLGEVVYRAASTFGPRQQKDLQLVYVHRGSISVHIDNRRFEMGPGDATLLRPGHREFFEFSRKGKTHHGWCVAVQPVLSDDELRRLESLPDLLSFTPAMKTLVDLALPLAGSRRPGDRLCRDALIRSIFLESLREAGEVFAGKPPVHPAVERACRLMEEQVGSRLDMAIIAGAGKVTPTHLIRLFHKQVGLTPMQYLAELRCRKAVRLLKETGLSVAEIAYQVGFANPQHFSRVFRRCRGTTPGHVRQEAWTSLPNEARA